MPATVPLKQWIKGAVESSSLSGTAVSSPAYIASSLRIAISLTQQICDAEALSNTGLFHGIASLPPPFPVACIDWADCITVNLKTTDEIREHDESVQPFPLSECYELSDSPPYADSRDLDELLDNIAHDIELGQAEWLHNHQNSEAAILHENNTSYLDVDCAQIFYSNGDANHVESSTEKMQRIYSLGLVFYQLFSGGELPPLDLLVISSPNGGEITVTSLSPAAEEKLLHASGYGLATASSDFARTLNMSDKVSLDRGGSPGGNSNTSNVQNQESINEYRTSFVSNKKQSVSSRSRQSVSSMTGAVLIDVSIDCLIMKGVPGPLCDLICNMLDCINGDFTGNDSYREIVDVTCDLQLMLDKPSVYLNKWDIDNLLRSGLGLDDTVFERKNEFASLQCAYRRSLSGSYELAIITGVSGTGKSTMANRLGDFITANGGLFLSGKFDQMMQQLQPFSAVASAFNNYCDTLARDEESDHVNFFTSKLRTALGSDLYHLIQVIPNLSQIISENSIDLPPNRRDSVDAQQRLQYLFCEFVEVISSCSAGPVTLFMDDVQWADYASISLIGQLLKTSRSMQDGKRVFFLGTCRDDEMGSDHLFWNMVDAVSSFGFTTNVVKLHCMDRDTVTQVLSNLLHLSPRLVGSLSDIVYHKTKGNPLFVSRMLLSLNREGLMHFNLTRYRWEWDEEKIQSRKLPDDVAMFFVHSINTLPIDVKIALVTLSCFGASTECEVIEAIDDDLCLNLIDPLNIAIEEGLLNKLDGRYCFCHDRIQEAAYSMIEEEDRCLHHMNYAATQLNLGGPSAVQDAEQYSQIADFNLIAGKRAMEMSDFSLAFSFFDHGITFLRKKHWQDQYELSLELFNLAAKCALAIKDLTSLTMLCDEVSRNARNVEDVLNCSFISMSALTHSRISEAVEYGLHVLSSQLGVYIPKSPSREDTLQLIMQTQSRLSGISEETLFSYHILTDYKKIMVLKFLTKLESSLQQVNPALLPFVTCKIVELTIEHGLSQMSAIGFAYFGSMIAELGDIRGGYRYTKLARTLLEENHCNEIAGEVLLQSIEILSYVEPLQTTNEHRIRGQSIAMAAGDVYWACMNKLMIPCTLMWSGANLSEVKEAFINARRFSEQHEHQTTLYYIKTFERTISKLLGDEDQTPSEDELMQQVIENNNPYQLVVVYFHKVFLALVFNNYDEMISSTEKFLESRMPSWHLLSGHAVHAFIGGLVSFRIYRETRDPLWSQRGEQFKQRIKTWKDQGSLWNFEHKYFLLDAEQSYSTGNFELARVSYENAILFARQHKFIHEEALAYELAANFYFNTGNKSDAVKCFMGAHGKYLEWGAVAKAQPIYAYTQAKFRDEFLPAPPSAVGESNDIQIVDFNTDNSKKRTSS